MDWMEIGRWIIALLSAGGLTTFIQVLINSRREKRKDITEELWQLYGDMKKEAETCKQEREMMRLEAERLEREWASEKRGLLVMVERARRTNGLIVAWQGAGGELLIRDVNPLVVTMFHWLPDEIINKPVKFLIPERFHAAHEKALNRLYETGKLANDGVWLRESDGERLMGRRKDGREFPISIRLSGFLDNDLWRLSAEIMEE